MPKNITSTLAIRRRMFFLLKAIPKAPIKKINPENIKKRPKLISRSELPDPQLQRKTRNKDSKTHKEILSANARLAATIPKGVKNLLILQNSFTFHFRNT
jgi:hypothetical protein